MSILVRFANESAPAIHITAGEVIKIGGISITNSMVYAWISSTLIITTLIIVAKMIKIHPRRGLIQLVEVCTDVLIKFIETNTGSYKKATKYAPYFAAIFFFILMSNWLGLLPIVGEAFKVNQTPLFRPFTADLNATLAAAVISLCLIQYFAVQESGLTRHLKHYFAGSLFNPLTWLKGIFEIFSESTRVISLSMRLFLNITVGEIIISVFVYLGQFAGPLTALPITFFELFVGALQAYIFTILCIIYLSIAIKNGEESDGDDIQLSSKEMPAVA